MTDVANRDTSALEAALEYHLYHRGFREHDQIRVALRAIIFGQHAADTGEAKWLDEKIDGKMTCQQAIDLFHLNSFIDWGGGEQLA
jgi:hypothetical protein